MRMKKRRAMYRRRRKAPLQRKVERGRTGGVTDWPANLQAGTLNTYGLVRGFILGIIWEYTSHAGGLGFGTRRGADRQGVFPSALVTSDRTNSQVASPVRPPQRRTS